MADPATTEAPAVAAPGSHTAEDPKGKRSVKINVEGAGDEDVGEGEMGRKRSKRFTLPDLPKWWQAMVIQYAFAHPHVRARLEKHMGTNLTRLTDKAFMSELEERIREVVEESLNKRTAARVLDEMERLKRLILIGKTPLKQCPPELYHHPVFVYWRMVNREVAKASKKRADAYYKRLHASQKVIQNFDDDIEEELPVEEEEQLSGEQLLARCYAELAEQKQSDIEKGVCFTDEQFAQLKFETKEVKELKTLSTVEELYAMADKIIGAKRIGQPPTEKAPPTAEKAPPAGEKAPTADDKAPEAKPEAEKEPPAATN